MECRNACDFLDHHKINTQLDLRILNKMEWWLLLENFFYLDIWQPLKFFWKTFFILTYGNHFTFWKTFFILTNGNHFSFLMFEVFFLHYLSLYGLIIFLEYDQLIICLWGFTVMWIIMTIMLISIDCFCPKYCCPTTCCRAEARFCLMFELEFCLCATFQHHFQTSYA